MIYAKGLTFMAVRIKIGVSAPVYLHEPGCRGQLEPSKRRNWMSSPIGLSTEPRWSMVVVESNEPGFEVRAGAQGLEALVLQFPREED